VGLLPPLGGLKLLQRTVQPENSTVVLQLYNKNIHHVIGLGRIRYLPARDKHEKYHIDSLLQVTDKATINVMTALLLKPIKSLGVTKKAFLSPLMRDRLKPCCDNKAHHIDYRNTSSSYLPALGAQFLPAKRFHL
jgi:hypothetical protein